MKTRIITTLLTAVFLVTAALPANAQSTEQLFQKGIMKEEGEGNLPEAIKIFNSIVEDSNADDALQAKALLHVGLCYEKLGKSEASRAYQKLINNFPARQNEVAIARERLSRLILANETNEMKSEKKELIVRKVLADAPSEPLGAPSPDGRYISFVDWGAKSNLSILDLNTNEKKCVTDFKNEDEQAYYSSWSPDGKKLAFFWWEMGENEDRYNISVVDVTENNQKNLYTSNQVNWIELGNWSSDGKYILATLSIRDHPESQIVRISTSDGSVDILKSCDISYLGGKPLFSPDNRFVAYDLPDEKASGNSDIHILSIDNKSDNPLFKHPAHDNILGWTPKGNNILFASDRKGTIDAMLIPVQDGKSIGKPILVKSNIGRIVPMGFTQKGSFYYGEWPDEQNIYSTEIDFEKEKILKQPTLAIKRFEGKNGSPEYSNDGRFLAYISARGVIRKGNPMTILCIRELATGKEYEIAPPLDQPYSISHPTWSPDDSSIALMLRNQDGDQRIYNYNLQTKSYSPLVTDPDKQLHGVDFIYPQWSLDGKTVYYFQLSPNSQTSYIKARNIETGKDKEIFQYSSDDFMDRIFTIALSPDGEWISAINRSKNRMIKLISTNGKETKDLDNFILPGGYTLPQFWSNDGKHIIYAFNTENGSWNLKRIPIDEGKKSEIEINILGINSPNLHPDGRKLIFSSLGFSFPVNPVWEMENFLPSENEETTAKEPEGITIKQVWTGDDVDDMGQVSRDGQFLSCVDWDSADLAIRNLKTKENKRLTHQGSWDEPYHYADVSLITEDGKNIIYSWYNDDDNYELRTINTDNPNPQTVYKPKKPEQIFPKLLYDNEQKVLVQRFNPGKTWYLASVEIDDGEINNLKDFEGNFAINLSISPDKKFFAFDFPNKEDKGMFDIRLLSINDKKEIPLVEHPANDRLLGWIPGTTKLLFTSDRSGSTDVWAMNTSRIPSANEPERILTNVGNINPLGYTTDGTLFYSTKFRRCNTYILPFNKSSGKLEWNLKEPLLGSILDPHWTKDGESMIYAEREKLPGMGWNYQLTFYDINTGNKKELATNINGQGPPSLSPDGKSLLIVGLDITRQNEENYNGGIFSVDILSGIATEIKVKEDIYRSYCVEWDKEGKNIFYRRNNRILKHNIASGDEIEIYKEGKFKKPRIFKKSWDGNHLLFDVQVNDSLKYIKSIPVSGGNSKMLCSLKTSGTPIMFKKIDYSTDGKFIYLAVDGQENGSVLYRVPSEGGEPEKIWQTKNRIAGLSIHPNENKIAISLYEGQVEIRKIENLKQEVEKIYAENE